MKVNPGLANSVLVRKSNSSELHLIVRSLLIFCITFAINDRGAFARDTGPSNPITADLTWSIVPSPRQGGVNIYGVSALSPTQAWAVGDIYGPLTPIIYRWNGRAWKTISPGSIPDSSLRDVAAIAANDVWAVGYQEDSSGGDLTLTQHWNGAAWTRVSSTNPSSENYLSGVAAVAATDVWAVGYKESGGLYEELILHWNGISWTESPTRGGAYRVLSDVAALSPNDVWAIGYQFSFNRGYQGLAMHWNGAAWSDVAIPVTGDGYTFLYGVTAISSTDIWAVGSGGVNPIKVLTAHWDGTAWTYVPNPTLQTDYAFLKNVTALASDDVWAIGYLTDQNGTDQNLVEHWDGFSWTQINVPGVRSAHNQLWGVAPDRAGGVWTAGSFLPTDFSRPLGSLVLRGSP